MRDYVVYHSVKKMKSSFRDGISDSTSFGIVTKKKTSDLIGATIWVISGEGTPCEYRLEYRFVVSGTEVVNEDEFTSRVFGTAGEVFSDGIPLNEERWFKAFLKTQFYSFGLQALSDKMSRHFREISSPTRASSNDSAKHLGQAGADAASPPPRVTILSERIIRDTKITLQVKHFHGHCCQVCRTRLETPNGAYAEAAHIRPLGRPHHGHDVADNVLCLCPNDHVLFDNGAFSIADNLTLIGSKTGQLKVAPGHRINHAYLAYHREFIFQT